MVKSMVLVMSTQAHIKGKFEAKLVSKQIISAQENLYYALGSQRFPVTLLNSLFVSVVY